MSTFELSTRQSGNVHGPRRLVGEQHVRSAGSQRFASIVLYWCCLSIFAAYTCGTLLFKAWYVAAAVTVMAILFLRLDASITVRGVFKASVPVLLYFATLLSSAASARVPLLSLQGIAKDSIEIPIFCIFYIFCTNSSSRTIIDLFATLPYIAAATSCILFVVNPEASRVGGYIGFLLPATIPFCVLNMRSKSYVKGHLAIVAALGCAAISMSRSSLIGSVIGVVASGIFASSNIRQIVQQLFRYCMMTTLLVGVLMSFETTRSLAMNSAIRLAGEHLSNEWKNMGTIDVEGEDWVRTAIYEQARDLFWESFPYGIGYYNFVESFEDHNGFPMVIHNTYQALGTECGILGLSSFAILLMTYFYKLRSLHRQIDDAGMRTLFMAFFVSMLSLLTVAIYHQLHWSPVFFMLLGCVAGLNLERLLQEVKSQMGVPIRQRNS